MTRIKLLFSAALLHCLAAVTAGGEELCPQHLRLDFSTDKVTAGSTSPGYGFQAAAKKYGKKLDLQFTRTTEESGTISLPVPESIDILFACIRMNFLFFLMQSKGFSVAM